MECNYFLDTYSQIDLLLREALADTDLTFTTSRARFLYLVETKGLSAEFKRLGSIVFNLHYRIVENGYVPQNIENDLAVYIYQELCNSIQCPLASVQNISDDKISQIKQLFADKFTSETSTKRLNCQIKEVITSKTKYGYPLYQLIATDENGDEVTIYLWLDTDPSKTPFHRRFDLIFPNTQSRTPKTAIFYNLSWKDAPNPSLHTPHSALPKKGYYFQNAQTHIVLTPDFLLDITAVAECFQSKSIIPALFFLKLIKATEFSIPMLKGNFINFLLDSVICGREIDIEQDLLALLESQGLKALEVTDEDIDNIVNEANTQHLDNLYKVAKFYEKEKITLEPSFISQEYGLQGRLDALIEYPHDQHNKTVFELKSGTPPSYSLWQNNYAQVMGYNLLLKSVFGKDRTGVSSLLYSKADKDPLRNVTYSAEATYQILMCRNIIVNALFMLSERKINLYSILAPIIGVAESTSAPPVKAGHLTFAPPELVEGGGRGGASLPKYHIKDIQEFQSVYSQMTAYEQKYFDTMTAFVMKELIAQKIGYLDNAGFVRNGHSALWSLSLSEKIKDKSVLAGLKLTGESDGLFVFESDTDADLSSFRSGDLLIIYPSLNGQPNPLKVPVFKATLREIEQIAHPRLNLEGRLRFKVAFRNELLSIDNLSHYDTFFAEFDIMETGFYNIPASMLNFFKIDPEKRKVFFGIKEPLLLFPSMEGAGNTFDRIMHKARHFQDYLLIQGPPGTGKTSKYLISIIKQHLSTNNTPIVILAFTHRAVDEIAQRLKENEMRVTLLSSNTKTENRKPKTEHRTPNTENRIFLSTLAHFQSECIYLKKHIDLDLLIVDEASQILEHSLVGIIAHFQKFILIGDHFQLPAIATQDIKDLPEELTSTIGIHSLQDSLFERLYRRCVERNWHQAYDLLPEHYRMHSEIADLINPFYDDKLRPSSEKQFSPFSFFHSCGEGSGWLKILSSSRTIFLPTTEKAHNRFNTEEAEKVLAITTAIYEILKENFTDTTLGIICTWKLQTNLIASLLSPLPCFPKITIDTVERFQGSERDIIIYSTAVSHPQNLSKMQSLTTDHQVDRKLNVAISRAKEQFILLGNKEILSLSPHYKRVIELILRYNQS